MPRTRPSHEKSFDQPVAGESRSQLASIGLNETAKPDCARPTASETQKRTPTMIPAGLGRRHPYGGDDGGLPPVTIVERVEEAVRGADVVMTLRLQAERQQSGLLPSLREYSRLYEITAARVALARPNALVMHPGPMNEGVEIAPDVAHGIQSRIEEQVTNGVAVRMALLYLLGVRR